MRKFALISALFLIVTIISNSFHQNNHVVYAAGSNITCESLSGNDRSECNACMGADDNTSTWTAIGCITTDPNSLLTEIIGLGMGAAGGIAFLLILFGGLQIMTSAGNPEQLNAGRELVSSAVTGLLIIIFSIFLLRFIGINIIGIPGFG